MDIFTINRSGEEMMNEELDVQSRKVTLTAMNNNGKLLDEDNGANSD